MTFYIQILDEFPDVGPNKALKVFSSRYKIRNGYIKAILYNLIVPDSC